LTVASRHDYGLDMQPRRALAVALSLVVPAAGCSRTAPSATPAAVPVDGRTAAGQAAAGPTKDAAAFRLATPGRVLVYHARSRITISAPEKPSRFVSARSTARQLFSAVRPGGGWRLRVDSLMWSGEDDRAGGEELPFERRREILGVDPLTFRAVVEKRTSEARRSGGEWGRPLDSRLGDDGFGLSFAARSEALLFTVAVPRDLFARLSAGEVVRHEFDFFLVRTDPTADRVVVDAGRGAAPAGAEWRIHGSTVLRPGARETMPLHAPVPGGPTPAEPASAPASLACLRVNVASRSVIDALREGAGAEGRTSRADDLTWSVLDSGAEPWLLAVEGTVRSETGEGGHVVVQDAFMARTLQRIESGDLDAPPPPP
jgi:hypothetical protein